jgi:hypothetical protein
MLSPLSPEQINLAASVISFLAVVTPFLFKKVGDRGPHAFKKMTSY